MKLLFIFAACASLIVSGATQAGEITKNVVDGPHCEPESEHSYCQQREAGDQFAGGPLSHWPHLPSHRRG